MKKALLFANIVLFLSLASNATIRRVGFFANQIPNVDYTTFALAYTAAANNDTILVFPGKGLGSQVINKKLIIIGTGNWLDPNSTPKGNAGLQAFASTPTADGIQFQSGSAGSVVMGFYFGGATIYVSANNITIRRNRDLVVNLAYNVTGSSSTPFPVVNLQVLENYKVGFSDSYNGFSNTNINTTSTFSGNISNNVFAYDATNAAGNGGASTMSQTNGISLAGGAWLFQNNILCSYTNVAAASNHNYFTFTGETNSVFNYNVALQSATPVNWGTGTGNIITPIANATTIFAAFPAIGANTADARYILGSSNAAKVAGRPGSSVDAGMFGGLTPYKLSTIPSIPTIYQLSSPDGNNPVGNSIQINFSTRGNN
jgi:hypothetical protein